MTTIRRLFEETVSNHASTLALQFYRDGEWKRVTYSALQARVQSLADAFREEIAEPPEYPHIALMSINRPEWIECYLAMTGSGYAVVPMDPKFKLGEAAYIWKTSRVFAIFTDQSHLPLLLEALPELPDLRLIVLFDGFPRPLPEIDPRCRILDYATLCDPDRPALHPWYATHGPTAQDVASIIFTSGTTGKPKGALLTHLNFCSDALGCFDAFGEPVTHEDNFLLTLPLFHAFAFTTNLIVPLIRGSAISFIRSLRTVNEDALTVKPTVIMSVPLLAEKVYAKLETRLQQNRPARILMAIGLGRIVGRRVKKTLGGRLRFLIVGGAPCPKKILRAYRKLGLPLLEGYGLTECAPVVSIAGVRASRIGTIGRKLPNIEVRIADPNEQGVGELQIRGPIVMKGYFQNPAATQEVFDGDWLKTGDLATMDADGYLSICGRKKSLIVNREGKNIYPEEVEFTLGKDPLLSDLIVLGYTVGGEPGERVGVIIAPNKDQIQAALGDDPAWEAVEELVQNHVKTRCEDLADYKHPRKIVVSHEPLERTSVQKVRRYAYQGTLNETA
ncbi:MAG: AMP-binding protein [Kiritimatiellae bacterium]|nr:AMP-binding protein [Kiritimatiellia bacterium]